MITRRHRWTLVLLLVILLLARSSAQDRPGAVITGRITDAETGKPLENVNVFLSSTTFGASTAAEGEFLFTGVPAGGYLLVASRIGYEREVFSVRVAGRETLRYTVALKPKVLQMGGVETTGEIDKRWKEDLKHFEKIFIGETESAKDCRFLNPEVINFRSEPGSNRLTAWSDSIVRVENRALGYDLSILMDTIRWNYQLDTGRYRLYTGFVELPVHGRQEMTDRREHRRRSYEGSLKHFLASVVSGRATDEGFWVYTDKPKMTLKRGLSFVMDPDELKVPRDEGSPFTRIATPERLKIEYLNATPVLRGYIRLNDPSILVDSLGNVLDPFILETEGWWAKQRVAELLPLNYSESSGK